MEQFMDMQRETMVNPKYKDTLFRMVFRGKEELLALYNALNRTDYKNADEMFITTLEDAVYIGMKNDTSFLFSGTLNLYEHQSSVNPNMPLRGFFYFARIYQNYVNSTRANIYGKKKISLPMPRYVVFYNGKETEADYQERKLSDAFQEMPEGAKAAVECRAVMLNINMGHNKELMEKCRVLWEYAYFVAKVREALSRGKDTQEKLKEVEQAAKKCIEKDILKKFLEKNRTEVFAVILEEFDRELYEEGLREEGLEEGMQKREAFLFDLYRRLSEEGRLDDWEKAVSDEEYRKELYKKYGDR